MRRIMRVGRVFFLLGVTWAVGAEPPPNVIVLLADDQGWGDVSLHGNTNLRTPALDSIARDGARFESFYVCPVCAPTRAEMLTGRYHSRGGVYGVSTGQERLNTDEKTLADAFKAAGYATGAFGKWHNGSQWPYHPNARGFDEYYGFTSGHWGEYFDAPMEHNGALVRGKGFIADDLTEHALAFIEKNKDRPFFCYVPFNTPHSPFCVPDEYWNRHKDQPVAMRGKEGPREDLPVTRCALAMCENLDANVGRVLRRLDALGLAERTIVVYFSDNGPNSWRWNGDMKGRKGSLDEGGLRVPCFIRWPGKIRPDTCVREIAGAVDLLPTLVALTGVARVGNKPLDGRDLSSLLLGVAPAPRKYPDRMIFSHYNNQVSVRTQRFRLDPQGALFDIEADPGQQTDVRDRYPDEAARLSKAVNDWRAEVFATPTERDRPFPVGFAEFPVTTLPARDGVAHGGIKRSARPPNSSYFTNWTRLDDSITWDIDVHAAGDYEVTLHYTCPAADTGAKVEVSFNDARTSGRVTPAWDPPLKMDEDRVPRRSESYMKEFRPLRLGVIRMDRGRGMLTLRALEIPGKSVMDVRTIALKLLPAAR